MPRRGDIFVDGGGRAVRDAFQKQRPCQDCQKPVGTILGELCSPCLKRRMEANAAKKEKELEKKVDAKLWVICKVGFEYEDEGYYRCEDSGYETPVKAFRDKNKAQAECDRMNGEWLRKEGKVITSDLCSEYEDDDGPPIIGYEIVEVEGVE